MLLHAINKHSSQICPQQLVSYGVIIHSTGPSDAYLVVPKVKNEIGTSSADPFSKGSLSYRNMEGIDCDSNDVELVAKAVQALIGLQAFKHHRVRQHSDTFVAVRDLLYPPSFPSGFPTSITSPTRTSTLIFTK